MPKQTEPKPLPDEQALAGVDVGDPEPEQVQAPCGPFVPGPTRDEVRKAHHSDKTPGPAAPAEEVKSDAE